MRDAICDNAIWLLFGCFLAHLYVLSLDRSARTLTGTSVGLGALPTQRQAAAVTDAPITTQVHQTLDVHADITSKITLDSKLGYFCTQRLNLRFGQIFDLDRWIDTSGLTNLVG